MTKGRQQSIFQEWLKAHKGLLFKVVKAYAHEALDQDDLFQEVCLQVWRSIPNFKGKSAVTTWLYRISLNTAMKWKANTKRHTERHHRLEGHEHVLQVEEKDDRIEWLYHEIGKLNKVERSLALLLLDGCSYREISEILGVSESNVGVKIHRIKKQLITASKKYEHHGI